MNDLKWQLDSTELLYETTGKGLRVQKRKYICEDGRTKTVELKDEGPFGHVFGITSENKIILIRQFRVGPDKYYWESPAGGLHPDQDPQIEALRELEEETGYTSNKISLLRASHDGAYTTAMRYMFLAENCVQDKKQHLDDDEYIDQIYLATLDELKQMLHKDEYIYPFLAYLALEKLGYLSWNIK